MRRAPYLVNYFKAGAARKIDQPPAPRNLHVIEQLRLFVMVNTACLDGQP